MNSETSSKGDKPFTEMFTQAFKSLRIKQAGIPNVDQSYVRAMLNQNWVPDDDDLIRRIASQLRQLAVGKPRNERLLIPNPDDWIAAAQKQSQDRRRATERFGTEKRKRERDFEATSLDVNASGPKPMSEEHYARLSEQTYYNYRNAITDPVVWRDVTAFLEKRYQVKGFSYAGYTYPITVLWQTTDKVDPDNILGELDVSEPKHPGGIRQEEREFIKFEYEKGDVKHEATDFRMIEIERTQGGVKIHGALGRYYDHVLDQFAIRWELGKFFKRGVRVDSGLLLPRRTLVEKEQGSPLLNGRNRCAAMAVETLMLVKRKRTYQCLICKRSAKVGQFPDSYQVVPAGMFESAHRDREKEWSIKTNVIRELLEEVYGEKELIAPKGIFADHMFNINPIPQLLKLLETGRAELSVTGVSVDLTTLVPEIATILVVHDEEFLRHREIRFNWEADVLETKTEAGKYPLNPTAIEELIKKEGYNVVPSAAVAIKLGLDWLKAQNIA